MRPREQKLHNATTLQTKLEPMSNVREKKEMFRGNKEEEEREKNIKDSLEKDDESFETF